jgi:succinate dehydrogenase hydrophobic anchor subunit
MGRLILGRAGWLLHRLTGLFLAVGLTVHFGVMHYGLPATYGKTFRMAFLSSAIYHALYGLWGIAVEHLMGRHDSGATERQQTGKDAIAPSRTVE